MGFLDKLRGGGDITLSVHLEPAEAGPGDEVTLRFDLGGELDDKCRDVLVRFVGEAAYKANEQVQDSDGNWERQEVWRGFELHSEEHHYPVQTGPGQATFTVPEDAPPSSSPWVQWLGTVTVDRSRGRDKQEKAELNVRRSAAGLPTARAPQRTEDGLTLDDVPTAVRAGDAVSGHLTVNVKEDVSVTAVRIRLHRKVTSVSTGMTDDGETEHILLKIIDWSSNTSTRITEDHQAAELDLSGKRDFKPGAVEQIPFSILVPATSGLTSGHSHCRVEWRLEAVLDRRMRDDLSVDTPLIVY